MKNIPESNKKARVANLRIQIGIMSIVVSIGSFVIYKVCSAPEYLCTKSKNTPNIRYDEENQIMGYLTSEEIDKHLRIVTLEQEGIRFQKLMYVESVPGQQRSLVGWVDSEIVNYIDFEKNWTMISYNQSNHASIEVEWYKGENIQIIEEKPFIPYLLKTGKIEDKYDATEILEVYDEVVGAKDTVKEISKKY